MPFLDKDGSYKQRSNTTGKRIHYQWRVEDEDSLLIYTHKWWEKKSGRPIQKERTKGRSKWNRMRKESYGWKVD